MLKRTLLQAAMLAVVSTSAMAAPVEVVGTLPVVVANHHDHQRQARALDAMRSAPPKIVSLMKVKLSSEGQAVLKQRVAKAMQKSVALTAATKTSSLPAEHQVGMNNIPVLDQGMHGSCVTFANSAALDAVMSKGDYVSQLCSLELGKTLEQQDYNHPSGWDGSWGPIVLKQYFDYGVVSMEHQHQYGCGGMTDYPVSSYDTGSAMSENDYNNMSENISNNYEWVPIVSVEGAMAKSGIDADEVLAKVKTALSNDNRVTFGVLLDVYYGSNGAVGTHNTYHDTWMLTPVIQDDADMGYINAGHEMVITGYDDDATVTAPDGTVNKGLFTLRNSWGAGAGDHGDYYMSYDHFKALAMEAQIVKAQG